MGNLVKAGVVLVGMCVALGGCSKENKEAKTATTQPATTKPNAARAKPTPTPKPNPVPMAAAPSCTSHKDCRVTCDLPSSCCGQLCICTTPYHKDQLDPLRAANKALCDKNPGCPKADCASPRTDHVPACLDNKCVAAEYPRPTPCKADSDCTLYCFERGDCQGQTCGPCGRSFHKKDLPALEAWRTKSCSNKGPWHERAKCSRAAMNTAPVCKQGRCATKNIPW